jgi:hypothetical protein
METPFFRCLSLLANFHREGGREGGRDSNSQHANEERFYRMRIFQLAKVKVRSLCLLKHNAVRGREVWLHTSLTSSQDGRKWSPSRPGHINLGLIASLPLKQEAVGGGCGGAQSQSRPSVSNPRLQLVLSGPRPHL